MAKNTFFFSHDGGARNDDKIIELRIKHGTYGYGLFLMIVEILLERKLRVTESEIIKILSSEGENDVLLIKSVLFDFKLFSHEKDFIDLDIKTLKIKKKFLSTDRLSVVNRNIWTEYRRIIFERDNYTCTYCKKRGVKLELDHIIPFSKGGEDVIGNLTTACIRCNRQKRDKSVNEFLKWQDQQKKG